MVLLFHAKLWKNCKHPCFCISSWRLQYELKVESKTIQFGTQQKSLKSESRRRILLMIRSDAWLSVCIRWIYKMHVVSLHVLCFKNCGVDQWKRKSLALVWVMFPKPSAVGAWLITGGYCGAAPRCVCVSVVISVYVWLIIVCLCASVCAS